MWGDVVISL